MLHPLQEWIVSLRRKVRGLSLLHGFAWLAAIALAVFLAVGLLDYLARLDDLGGRMLIWVASLATLAAALWWLVVRRARARLSDTNLALRLERRFPPLRDRLASTLQFLADPADDVLAGSATLRRAVVLQVADDVRPLRRQRVIETRPVLKAAAVAGGLMLLVAALAIAEPRLTAVAALRQLHPWGNHPWPRQTQLVVRGPAAIARGSNLGLEIVDRENRALPELITMHLAFEGQEPQIVELRPQGEVLPFQLPDVQTSLTLWAEGGDDRSMRRDPIHIEVVDTPTIADLKVTLHPPAYTAWPATAADRHFRALQGTRIEFAGQASMPLSAVYFTMHGAEWLGVVAADGLNFSFHLPAAAAAATPLGGGAASSALLAEQPTVATSGAYSLRLVGKSGFAGTQAESYDITSLPDQPPQVVLSEPRPDEQGSLYVAADAELALLANIQEDRTAIRDVSLRYTRSDRSDQAPQQLVIHQGPAAPPARPEGLASPNLGESLAVPYRWSLASLKLPPKTQVEVTVIARDYRGSEGASTPPLRLVVASQAELLDRLTQQQSELLSHLAEMLALQRQARSGVSQVQLELENLGGLRQPGFDQLKGAVSLQGQVRQGLADPERGLPAEVARLQASLQRNGLDASDTRRRLELLANQLGSLEQSHLEPLSRQLPQATRQVQAAFDDDPADQVAVDESVPTLLGTATGHQDAVIAALEKLQADMTQWDNYRRFSREIGALRREHDEVAAQTAAVARDTVTKDFQNLTPQQQTDLRQLAKREDELARRLDVVQQTMERMNRELQEADPLAAGVLADALHHARSAGLSNRLRQASQQVEQNQVGQALGDQQAASSGLEEMLNILANRREHELSRLIEKLREAEAELKSLQERQQGLRDQAKAAASNPAEQQRKLQRLQKEQQALQEEAARLSRKLERLQAEQAGKSLSRAGEQMQQAANASGDNRAADAEQAAEDALQDLDKAQQELEQRRRQAERDLAEEQLAKIEDRLRGLRDRQQTLVDEAQRLANLAAQRAPTRAEQQTARDAARQEALLQAEADELRRMVAGAEVFAVTLQYASDDMARASRLLEQANYTVEMTTAASDALRRLSQLVAALEAGNNTPPAGQPQQGNPAGQNPAGQQPQDGIPPLAQLKLLKSMQEDLKQRTEKLAEAWPNQQQLPEAAQRQYEQIAAEQGRLAELLLNLSQPAADDTEPDSPREVPDLKLDDFKLDDLKLEDLKSPTP